MYSSAGMGLGFWLMGQLGRAWVGAWGGAWVDGWVMMWWGVLNAVLYRIVVYFEQCLGAGC